MKFKALQAAEEVAKAPNKDLDSDSQTQLLNGEHEEHVDIIVSTKSVEDPENQDVSTLYQYHGLYLRM